MAAEKPINHVTTTSMIIWGVVLLAVIAYVGISQGTSPFQKSSPAGFQQSGQLNKSFSDSWVLVYEDKDKNLLKVELVFDKNSQCGTKDILKPCDPKLYKANDQVTIEGNQTDQTVTVVKLIK